MVKVLESKGVYYAAKSKEIAKLDNGLCNLIMWNSNLFVSIQPLEGFYDFPVPKNAKVVQENEKVKNYTWAEESEENGIPLGYELVLKLNGWEKGERDGASVIYIKGNQKIDLIFTSKHLTIIKVR